MLRRQISYWNTGKRGVVGTFDPLSIANCELWFDADDPSTITLDIDDLVEQWNDKSGNNRHARNDTSPTFRPPISSTTQNGRTLINESGGRFLDTPNFVLGDFPVTIFFVGNKSGGGYCGYTLSGSQVNYLSIRNSGTGIFFVQRSGDTEPNSSTSEISYTLNDFGVFEGVSESNTTYKAAINGGSYATGAISQNFPTTANFFTIGRVRNAGNILASQSRWAEILMYSKILTSQERSDLVNYLMNKWGI